MLRFVLLAALGSFFLLYAADSPLKRIFPYDYKAETLPNGLKIIMIPMPSNGIVAYYSIVRTGSRDEYEPGHSGFAHFFEHMMFRGTKKYPADTYDKIVTSIGADANAYTTDDYTCFHLNFTKDNLEKVVDIESDRFQNLFYEVPAFQTESGAVYGEYRKGKTQPFFWLEESLLETAFDVHTYKHTTIGFEKDVKAMPEMYDYSRSFFKRYYRPENIVIVVAGDIQYDNTIQLIKKYYSNWQQGYVTPQIQPEPEQKGERAAKVNYPGKTLPIIGVAYKGSAFNPKDKNDVAAMLLGELAFGSNSDIYKKLYLSEQKIQLLEPEFNMNRDPFLWIIWAMIKDANDIEYVKDEIYTTLSVFQTKPVDAVKLDNLKKRMKYEFLMSLDTPDKTAGNIAREIAITGGIESIEQFYVTVESITQLDIQNAAKLFFVPDKRTVITLMGSK